MQNTFLKSISKTLGVATALCLVPMIASATNLRILHGTESAPDLSDIPVENTMAKPPPREDVQLNSSPGKPVNVGRYIVTHNCPSQTPAQISGPMTGMEYNIQSKMQFTPQFVVTASDDAIAALRKMPCVKQIQGDGLSAPQ